MLNKGAEKVTICCFLLIQIQVFGRRDHTFQDQTSPRTNTLFDDADDIQRQLDNEARDRLKFGRNQENVVKTEDICALPPIPPKCPEDQEKVEDICNSTVPVKPNKLTKPEKPDDVCNVTPPLPPPSCSRDWDYEGQQGWAMIYADCAGRSQSPVDLPTSGLVKARGARPMLFQNYNVAPKSMTLLNDKRRVLLVGDWQQEQRPLVYGGAAHSRRYLFHSLALHWPSEHTIGGMKYPLESQAFFVSAEYKNLDEALEASPADPQAFLGIATLYKYGNHTHPALDEILDVFNAMGSRNGTLMPKPLAHFTPPFKEYACYQGSLSWPPCTESVLWLIRGRTLSVKRSTIDNRQLLMTTDNKAQPYLFRMPQPMNDRKVYFFKA